MSAIRLGARSGGRQAPRRESLVALRYGWTELAATVVVVVYGGLAVYLVGELGLTTSEAVARTVRLGTLWDGFETDLTAFGFDRPPLLTALALPFSFFPGLREHGLAAALGTSMGAGLAVVVATSVARGAGFGRVPRFIFVVAFAFNPVLLYAGVFGLPESIYASLVLMALAEFGQWLHRGQVAPVIASGVALGFAFLVRYDVLLIAGVMAWGYWYVARIEERRELEPEVARANALAFLVPVVFVVGLWTLISWFPNGDALQYLTQARELTRLGADDLRVIQRMQDFSGDPLAVAGWVGWWTLLVGAGSVLATAGLAFYAFWVRSRAAAVLALLCFAVLLPEIVSLVGGFGQARVPHLFVAVVPVFVVVAYRELNLTGGTPPSRLETPRRRGQLVAVGGLMLASLASTGALLLMPSTDPPAEALETTIRTGIAPTAPPSDALEVARFIEERAGPGDVIADIGRHADVMALVGDMGRFRTDASEGQEATLYEPFESAAYILVRRPLAGQGEGRIERAYEDLFTAGSASLALEFEAGDYRLYAVTGPAVP